MHFRVGSFRAVVLAVVTACAGPPATAPVDRPDAEVPEPPPVTIDELETIDVGSTYLRPNVEDRDGTPGFIHVTETDMPLRVAIAYPKTPSRGGSRADGRRVAIESIELWEDAIRPRLPWFRVEFVEEDPYAAVQVVWKRRINGPWGGFGRLRYEIRDGVLRVGGEMQVSTTPTGDTGMEVRVKIDELRFLIAHEFGHVLGLGHCFECDSAMNYSWNTLGRIFVTEEDVRAFLALVQQPNGFRIDGRPLSWIPEGAVGGGESRPASR